MDSDQENDDYERPLPDKVLEYYQQHALNPELPKYFLGTTIACNTQTHACSSKGISPRDVTHETIKFRFELESSHSDKDNEGKESSINLNEDNESKMLSPTSSIASNKKLEWDNGADIGYDNCHKLIPRQRSASFPNLYDNARCYDIARKHVESYFLKQDQSDDGVEEISMKAVETAVKSISGGKESSGSSRSTKSEKLITDSSTTQTPGIPSCTSTQTNEANIDIHKYISSSTNSNLSLDKQFTDTLAYILQKIGVPAGQSTPNDDERKQIYIDTPILKGSLKPHRKLTSNDYNEVTTAEKAKEIAITKPNGNVLKSLSDSESGNCRTKFQYKENEFESSSKRKDGISDCSRKLESGGVKSYDNTEIKPVDIERTSDFSKNLQRNELKPIIKKKSKASSDSSSCSGKLERSTKNHDICTKLMKINKRINLCKTKPIFIECVDFEKKQCADKDSQTTFLQKDTGSKCIQTDNRPSPEDVIKRSSETKRLKTPTDVQKVVYLQHSDIQNQSKTKSSDTQTDTDGQISHSRSFEYLKGSTLTQTPKEIGTEKPTKVDKSKSKSDITSKDESDSSSVHEHLLTELLSINYSKDLTVDLEHTIKILQKLLRSRKYDELTKRYYIKKVVRKIVESRYTDDSTTSSELFRPKKSSFQLKEVNANVNIVPHSSEHSSIDKQKANLMDNLPWYPANREYKQVTSSRKKLSKLSCKVTRTEIIPDVKEKILLKQTSKDDHDIRKPSIINKAKEVLQKQKQLVASMRENNRIRRSPSSFESNTPRSQSPEITRKPIESPEETQSSEDKRTRNQSKPRQEPQDSPVEKILEQDVHQSRAIPTTQITKMTTKDWKGQKTFSEMLLENKNKPTSIRRAGQGDYLVHLAKNERRHQLSWITNEIDHLQKLKGLLEKNPKIDRTRKAALTEALEKLYVKDMKGEKKVCASLYPSAEPSAVQTCPALGCPKAVQVCGCRRERESQTKPPCVCIPQGSQSRYQTENSTQAEDSGSVSRSLQSTRSERRNSVSSTKSQNDRKEKKSKRKDKNRKSSKVKEDKENGDKENGDKEYEDQENEDEENDDKSDNPKTLRGACGDAEPCKCTQTHEPKVTQCPATVPCSLSCQTCGCPTEDVMCGCDEPCPEDAEVEQLMECVCCKRRNVTIPRLQNLCNRLNLPPLCYPCYTLNEKSFYPYGYDSLSHQCICYTMVDNGTIDAIQRTVTDLRKLEACEQYCSVLKDCQTCCVCGHKAKLPERFKNGVAYFLRVEDECPVSVCKEKPPPKPCGTLDEVKIKVPCITCPDPSKKCGCGDGGCKPTLQDYLCLNRPCFVKSAEMRRTTVLSAVCEREADKDERKLKFLDEQSRPKRYDSPVSVYYSAVQEHSPFKSRKVGPRLFSEEEMKKMTERNYKRMSGFKQKEEKEKQRKLKVSNRIIADTFSKRLQRYVLKGKRNLPIDVPVVSY